MSSSCTLCKNICSWESPVNSGIAAAIVNLAFIIGYNTEFSILSLIATSSLLYLIILKVTQVLSIVNFKQQTPLNTLQISDEQIGKTLDESYTYVNKGLQYAHTKTTQKNIVETAGMLALISVFPIGLFEVAWVGVNICFVNGAVKKFVGMDPVALMREQKGVVREKVGQLLKLIPRSSSVKG